MVHYMTMQEGFLNNDLMSLKPVVSEDGSLSFEELLALNKDTRAWITLDGTNIDYPMVQGKDDMEYVNKDVEGNFSLSGSIFNELSQCSGFFRSLYPDLWTSYGQRRNVRRC